mmetsp:Transcript_15834/g.43765  ORF Transcript_15834/g.43765 Transcript_15834/m.43765 type:complete len:245 (-) Transcript_15834:1047-1781(-)
MARFFSRCVSSPVLGSEATSALVRRLAPPCPKSACPTSATTRSRGNSAVGNVRSNTSQAHAAKAAKAAPPAASLRSSSGGTSAKPALRSTTSGTAPRAARASRAARARWTAFWNPSTPDVPASSPAPEAGPPGAAAVGTRGGARMRRGCCSETPTMRRCSSSAKLSNGPHSSRRAPNLGTRDRRSPTTAAVAPGAMERSNLADGISRAILWSWASLSKQTWCTPHLFNIRRCALGAHGLVKTTC